MPPKPTLRARTCSRGQWRALQGRGAQSSFGDGVPWRHRLGIVEG